MFFKSAGNWCQYTGTESEFLRSRLLFPFWFEFRLKFTCCFSTPSLCYFAFHNNLNELNHFLHRCFANSPVTQFRTSYSLFNLARMESALKFRNSLNFIQKTETILCMHLISWKCFWFRYFLIGKFLLLISKTFKSQQSLALRYAREYEKPLSKSHAAMTSYSQIATLFFFYLF